MTAAKRKIAAQIESLTNDDLSFLNKKDKTGYLYKPPTIRPNYGKQKSSLPKTKMSRVLLYDNSMQDQMLDVRCTYIDRQKKRVTLIYEKSRYAFQDRLSIRRKWHESWEVRYQRLKDAFVAKYGTKYMPVPTPDDEKIDPFLINARIAPPINVLVYYIAAQEEAKQKKKMDIAATKRKISDMIDTLKTGNDVYLRSIEDPRFQTLQETLADPGFKSEGYVQLGPNYANVPNEMKWKPAKREPIVLPNFYQQLKAGRRDSVASDASRKSSARKRDLTLPEVKCDAYSLSSIDGDNKDDVTVEIVDVKNLAA